MNDVSAGVLYEHNVVAQIVVRAQRPSEGVVNFDALTIVEPGAALEPLRILYPCGSIGDKRGDLRRSCSKSSRRGLSPSVEGSYLSVILVLLMATSPMWLPRSYQRLAPIYNAEPQLNTCTIFSACSRSTCRTRGYEHSYRGSTARRRWPVGSSLSPEQLVVQLE